MKIIATNEAPQAIGPYSQGKIVGGMAYFAGQGGVIPGAGVVEGGIQAETEQACKNIGALLEVYAKYIKGAPARSCVAVKTLPKNVLVEIEAIAEIVG